MATYDMTGRLYKIFETQEINERFKKREFVLEVEDGRYTQLVKFELTQDRCSLLDGYKADMEVKVSFGINGREWTSPKGELKYFTTINAFRITTSEENVASSAPPPPAAADMPADSMEDDLPF